MIDLRMIVSALLRPLSSISGRRPEQARAHGAVRTPAEPTVRSGAESAPITNPRGSAEGWLRVLGHEQLLQNVQAEKAIREIWRQSRLSALVWERDCLPALRRYAEFVQLAPASESHHHAHAGGLLSHTIEMVLAAMTWRNGHLLPAGAPIEVIDSQRDEWTYVVFFAALLHDVAKLVTDLRIQWRCSAMAEPLRWMPLAGSLPQVTHGRAGAEYLVEFMPRSARDYTAHARLAMTLLPVIAPASALAFLARQPQAFEALNQYLTGQDKDSLLAQVVTKADRASTERSLLTGSRARFSTATTVPLVDLLMQAIRNMLRTGTVLPLNRSGAAGWVYDGSVWFVAKRLADSVRAWIKTHAPDEPVPGDAKNDRLFDTWQEYGCIMVNPDSGQAVWYVTVHGGDRGPETDSAQTAVTPLQQGAYEHSLTMLRFPLEKLYTAPEHYPAAMRGRIEVRARRREDVPADRAQEAVPTGAAAASTDDAPPEAPSAAPTPTQPAGQRATAKPKTERSVREPVFNKPRSAPAAPPSSEPARASAPAAPDPVPIGAGGEMREHVEQPWLDADDDASSVVDEARNRAPKRPPAVRLPSSSQPGPVTPPQPDQAGAAPDAAPTPALAPAKPGAGSTAAALRAAMTIAPLLRSPARKSAATSRAPSIASGRAAPAGTAQPDPQSQSTADPAPVLLVPRMPALPKRGAATGSPAEPSARAVGFMQWLQASLADRRLKYNESGAPVHFTAEGMALVSPLIFKSYAHELGHEADVDEFGLQIQSEVIKAGWHMVGPNKTNVIAYDVIGSGGAKRSRLSTVVLVQPDRWVLPVPPTNPALKIA